MVTVRNKKTGKEYDLEDYLYEKLKNSPDMRFFSVVSMNSDFKGKPVEVQKIAEIPEIAPVKTKRKPRAKKTDSETNTEK